MRTINPNRPFVVNPEEMFPLVEKMIYRLAWRTSETYPISFEEARSEAYAAFLCCCQDYKPDRKMKFTSACYYWIWTILKDLVMKRSADPLNFIEEEKDLVALAGGKETLRVDSLDLAAELSEDAKEIIQLLVETPGELLEGVPTPKQLLSRVKTHLINQGRERGRIEKAHVELRSRFQEVWAT